MRGLRDWMTVSDEELSAAADRGHAVSYLLGSMFLRAAVWFMVRLAVWVFDLGRRTAGVGRMERHR